MSEIEEKRRKTCKKRLCMSARVDERMKGTEREKIQGSVNYHDERIS